MHICMGFIHGYLLPLPFVNILQLFEELKIRRRHRYLVYKLDETSINGSCCYKHFDQVHVFLNHNALDMQV